MILRMASFALLIVTNNVVVYAIAKCFQGLAYAAATTVIPTVIGSANSKAALGTAYFGGLVHFTNAEFLVLFGVPPSSDHHLPLRYFQPCFVFLPWHHESGRRLHLVPAAG